MRSRARRMLIRYLPLVGTLAGMALILGSFILFANDSIRIVLVFAGVLCLLAGVWYAANPFFRSERRYLALRGEVGQFMQLVRRLNRAAGAAGSTQEVERIQAEMRESIRRMAQVAGKEGSPPNPGGKRE